MLKRREKKEGLSERKGKRTQSIDVYITGVAFYSQGGSLYLPPIMIPFLLDLHLPLLSSLKWAHSRAIILLAKRS
jgi:hypothetical protein